MGAIIRVINGTKHVLAHEHEPHAIEHDGEWWRPLPEPCHWCGSDAGYSPGYDGNDRCDECQGC